MSIYREILKRAFTLSIKNPGLWILGFFAAFLGNGGEFEILFKNSFNLASLPQNIKELPSAFESRYLDTLLQHLTTPSYFSALVILLFLLVFALAIISQGAIFISIYRKGGEKPLGLRSAWLYSRRRFFSILAINITAKGLLYSILAVVSFFIYYIIKTLFKYDSPVLLPGILFAVLTPAAVFSSFIVKFAVAYLIIQKDSFLAALKNSLVLFKNNWIVSLELALILFILNIVVTFLVMFASLVISFPLILILALRNQGIVPLLASVNLIFVVFIAVFIVTASFYSTFQSASWVLLFLKLQSSTVTSKISRVIHSANDAVNKLVTNF